MSHGLVRARHERGAAAGRAAAVGPNHRVNDRCGGARARRTTVPCSTTSTPRQRPPTRPFVGLSTGGLFLEALARRDFHGDGLLPRADRALPRPAPTARRRRRRLGRDDGGVPAVVRERGRAFEILDGRINAGLIWESVVRANAAERRGTHATKNRALVSGSGKKPWRQKGTGRARVGSIRNPLWRHGGTVFGPQPRSYDYTLPKKVELGALRAALAAEAAGRRARRRRRADRVRDQDEGGGRDAEAARRRRQGACSSTWRWTRSWRGRCATSGRVVRGEPRG